MRQTLTAGRIVAPLAAHRLDVVAGIVALGALEIDPRVLVRDGAR